jgi:hypothetical protein
MSELMLLPELISELMLLSVEEVALNIEFSAKDYSENRKERLTVAWKCR